MRRALPLLVLLGCAAPPPRTAPQPARPPVPVAPVPGSAGPTPARVADRREAALAAFRAGLMPLHATGVDQYAQLEPERDGRGVLIAILDSGIDPDVPGLQLTSEGRPKLVDLRDFSGEGRIALSPAVVTDDTVRVARHGLGGASRVLGMATGAMWGGLVPEVRFGNDARADLDGDGEVNDTLMVVVARGAAGWLLFVDRRRDGSLADDEPVRDYLVARESFGWSAAGEPPLGIAANLADSAGVPRLDLVFDNSGHGTHVAGIAAGHDLFGVDGFDGVAPGARLLGLKIADNGDGGITTTASMRDAIVHAVDYAAERRWPLVINVSFGVGNQREGTARIDHVVDSILAAHPAVVMTVAASNDGPGLSTLGFPASAAEVLSVGATLPLVFSGLSPRDPTPDPVAYFSSRGGERHGPDVLAPGTAWSVVPRFDGGNEEKSGTSMAAPHVAGLAARLLGIPTADGAAPSRALVAQAIRVTARQVGDATVLDQGTGVPDIFAAARWLAHQRGMPQLGVVVEGEPGHDAIWLPVGEPPSSVKVHLVRRDSGEPVLLRLRTTAPWLTVDGPTVRELGPGGVAVYLHIDRALLPLVGVRVGALVVEDAADESLGALARVPVTVRLPLAEADGASGIAQVHAGGAGRHVFRADSGRGLRIEVATLAADGLALVALHEPGGQPFRDVPFTPAGYGDGAGLVEIDARDVQEGFYELVILAPPTSGVAARVTVRRSPVEWQARRDSGAVVVDARNVAGVPVELRIRAAFTGVEWRRDVSGIRSEERAIELPVPEWASTMVLDVTMPQDDWSRFTDFGVSLRHADGRLLEESPLNYAFGRMRVEIPEAVRGERLQLVLAPAAVARAPATPWQVHVVARFYAAQPTAIDHGGTPRTRVGAGVTRRVRFPIERWPVQVAGDLAPLVTLIALEGDAAVWTREVVLPDTTKGTP
jgi:subtilisin family serine protease